MRVTLAVAALVVLSGLALAALRVGDPGDGTLPGAPSPTPAPSASPSPDGEPEPAPTPTAADGSATLVMWSRGELDAGVAERAAQLPYVEATAFVRSQTVGLVGSRDAHGRPADELEEGWRIPVDVVAVDPSGLAAILPDGPARDAVAGLRAGELLLSEAAAELRRMEAGGSIDLAGRGDLRVAAVVPDGTVRNAELVLHVADADAVGLGPDGSVIVRHAAPDPDAVEELREALRALAPEDRPARVVGGRGGGDRHRAPLVLSHLEVKSRFGEFAFQPGSGREIRVEPGWVQRHIVWADVPILGRVRCHQEIVDDLRAALAEIVDAGLAHEIDPGAYGGCYHPRLISADRDRLSRHSWGIAFDVNVDLSQPGGGRPPPEEVVDILGRHGFRWGGDFLRPDNHHFEWIGAEAAERPQR